MEDIISYSKVNTVDELTNVINSELNKAAISFVRVGYLLKRARDEEILKDSGYPDIYVYANTKFGLDKSQVSRFININDRYSIGGYSEHLKEEYEGYGYSKLALMLTLPDEINEELSPEYSKSEINAIKSEYEAESKISDMEVMMEEKEDEPDEFIMMIVKELNDEQEETAQYFYRTMEAAKNLGIEVSIYDIKEAYLPDGVATYSIRIPGKGRYLVSMKEEGIVIINVREPENKSPLSWEEFKDAVVEDMEDRDYPKDKTETETVKKKTERVKPAKVPNEKQEKAEVAPVQQEKTAKIQNEEAPERLSEDDVEIVGQSTDNVAQEEPEKTELAAGVEETDTAAGLTSSQTDMLEWLVLLRRKVVPEDGSRPDWINILDEIKTMERFVKQLTY